MKPAKDYAQLTRKLQSVVHDRFPGMSVEIGHSKRWDRPCVTFTSSVFDGLLPEERFHRLVSVIPGDLRDRDLAGFVWLELAEGESLDEFMKLPRSEDVAGRERKVYGTLARNGLFESLSDALGASPEKHCKGDFSEMTRLLELAGLNEREVCDAKLLMIRHHAYCDCQVLLTAQTRLAQLFADAA